MKVKLSVLERLLFLGTLPAEDNYATLKIIRNAKDTIGFNEEELKLLNFSIYTEDGKQHTKWDSTAVQEKEFDIGEKLGDLIAERLMELNKQKKLTLDHISLYDKFVGERC